MQEQQTLNDTCPELTAFRAKNNARQKKFYEANREEMNKKRRERYALGKAAMQAQAPAGVQPIAISTPSAPVVAATPVVQQVAANRRSTRVVKAPAVSVVQPNVAPVIQVANKTAARAASTSSATVKPTARKVSVGNQGKFGYLDLSAKSTITLDEICNYIKTIITDPKNVKTVSKYCLDVKALFKTCSFTNLVTGLKKPAQVIEEIDTSAYAVNSKKSIIQIILWMIDHFELKIEKAAYMHQFEIYKIKSSEERDVKIAQKLKYTFKEYLEKVKEIWGEKSDIYVIAKLYYELPVRDDFGLVITRNKEQAEDGVGNWLYVPEPKMQGKKKVTLSVRVYINHFKTLERTGAYSVALSSELGKIIRDYVANKKDGDLLFGRDSLSDLVSKKNKALGMKGGITLFREMRTKELDDDGLWNDPSARADLAKLMGHSTATQARYLHK